MACAILSSHSQPAHGNVPSECRRRGYRYACALGARGRRRLRSTSGACAPRAARGRRPREEGKGALLPSRPPRAVSPPSPARLCQGSTPRVSARYARASPCACPPARTHAENFSIDKQKMQNKPRCCLRLPPCSVRCCPPVPTVHPLARPLRCCSSSRGVGLDQKHARDRLHPGWPVR